MLDKPLALTSPTPQVIDDELVPIGEAPGRFDGFAKRDDALALAGRSKEVAVVVNDGKRYHVLRTTAATLGGTTAAPKLPKGWTVDKVVEPTNVPTDTQFQTAFDDAKLLSGKDREEAFRQLLVRSTHLAFDETAWSPNANTYTEGKVNVAPWLNVAGRHLPAKVVPTGSDPLPKTAILIGEAPLGEGPMSVRTTLLHEQRHSYHRTQTLTLIERVANGTQAGHARRVERVVEEAEGGRGADRGLLHDDGGHEPERRESSHRGVQLPPRLHVSVPP